MKSGKRNGAYRAPLGGSPYSRPERYRIGGAEGRESPVQPAEQSEAQGREAQRVDNFGKVEATIDGA